MHKNLTETFKNQKLSLMRNVRANTIHFPNKASEKQLVCDSEDTLAMAYTTILKAGFNYEHLDLRQENNTVSVFFNNKPIQKLVFHELDGKDKSKQISDFVKKNNATDTTDKVTYVFFDRGSFLKNKTPLSSYLSNLRDIASNKKFNVKQIREYLLTQSGIYIEEYENKEILLQEHEVPSSSLISHHNTFSTQIVYGLENLDAFKASRKNKFKGKDVEATVGHFNIDTNLRFGAETPIYSINPIINVANYRDLDKEELARKLPSFLDTLIRQAHEYHKYEVIINNPNISEDEQIESFNAQMGTLRADGAAKSLYSLAPSEEVKKRNKSKEIFVYEGNANNENLICISSKGSCLGNGQHSTTVFDLLNKLLKYNDETSFILKEHYDMTERNMAELFRVNSNNDPYKELSEKLKTTIEASGLSFEQFMTFYDKVYMPIEWIVEPNSNRLDEKITNDNAQKEQSKDDDWLNENKKYISDFLSRYTKANQGIINRYSEGSKDPNHFASRFNTSMEIKAIKTPEMAPMVSNDFVSYQHINEIYEYMSFILPKDKHTSPVDGEYQTNILEKTNAGRGPLRNVYQPDSMSDEKIYKMFSETFDLARFQKVGNKDAFSNFLFFMSGQYIHKNSKTKEEVRNAKFLQVGQAALENEENIHKIPAIILYKDMAHVYFEQYIKPTLPTNAINKDNFTKLAFTCFVQKIGKLGHNYGEGFNLKNIESNGEVILKDISNALFKYYNTNENYILTDKLKREGIKDSKELLGHVREFVVDLFEPYYDARINKRESFDRKQLNNIKYNSVSEALAQKTQSIEIDFNTNFGQTKTQKMKRKL